MTRRNWLGGWIASLFVRQVPPPSTPAPPPPDRAAGVAAMQRQLRDAFPYPVVTVSGGDALATWERLRREGQGWPVVVGDDEALLDLCDQFAMADLPSVPPATPDPAIERTIAASRALAWPNDMRQWGGSEANALPPSGRWPEAGAVAPNRFTIASNARGDPLAQVHVVLLPTTQVWEVPAYLGWGNWNGCPPPEYHGAALRDWQRRFGAELVGINRDTIELRVARRPADRAQALALAREQYAYCPDIVDQGAMSIEALAAILLESDWWFFWWD